MLTVALTSTSAWNGRATPPPDLRRAATVHLSLSDSTDAFLKQSTDAAIASSPMLSKLAATDPAVFGVEDVLLSVPTPTGLTEQVPAQRFVEADVGMNFPLRDLTERLYASNGPWPADYPFPPQAFKREDESDDYDFYLMPRFCYHIDEGAVRAITNYYKQNIADGSAVLDICSSWVSHYPADFPQKMSRISATGMNALE